MKVKIWKLIPLLLIIVLALSTIETVLATGTLQPSSTLSKIGGFPAYDSGKGEVFLLQGDGSVAVISDSTNNVSATINTGIAYGDGHELVYDSGKGEIFATSGGYSGPAGELESPPTVTIISDSNNSVIGTVTEPQNMAPYNNPSFSATPLGMAYDPNMGEIFLCDNGGHYKLGGVYVISDSNNSVVTEISVPNAHEAVYDPTYGEIFVTNGNNVTVISDKTNAVVASIIVGSNPYGIAYDSNKGEIFVFNENDGTISVISGNPPRVMETIKGITPEGDHPISIAYDPVTNEIFASNVTISDSTDQVTAGAPIYTYPGGTGSFQQNFGNVAYDSGKGEMVAGGLTTGLGIFKDTSSPSASSTSSSQSTSPASPTPTVPEFGSSVLIVAAAAMAVLVACVLALKMGKRRQLRR